MILDSILLSSTDFTMIVDTIAKVAAAPIQAFVFLFQQPSWHEIGFVGRVLRLVMGRAAGRPDDDEVAIMATW